MPRKEYKTITVKAETQEKFLRAVRDAKRGDSTDNSKFLDLLLSTHKRSKSRWQDQCYPSEVSHVHQESQDIACTADSWTSYLYW